MGRTVVQDGGDPGVGATMDFPRLVRTVFDAPWLPGGSSAEVWVGDDLDVPRPAVAVRLLLMRAPGEVFCVPTATGPDLPAVAVDAWRPGLAGLCRDHLGREVATRCVGYVRTIVPEPDETYRLPVPVANVPVFTPRDPGVEPLPDRGNWVGRDDARRLLAEREWWLVACAALAWIEGV